MNRNKQNGITLIGWLVIISIIGIFAIALLKAGPVYMEYYKVSQIMAGMKKEMQGETVKRSDIINYMEKRFDIDAVTSVKAKEVKVRAEGNLWAVHVTYDRRTNFLGNLDFIVTFDKTVEVNR